MAKKVEKIVSKNSAKSDAKKAPQKVEKQAPKTREASAKVSAGFSKEELALAKAAYGDDVGYDVYAKVYALDGALFEILENKKTGEGIVFRLPFSTSAAEKGKNPYTEVIPWMIAPSAFTALYKLNGAMKEENASAWRLQRKAQEEMKKVAKEMRIEEKEAQRKKEREDRKEAKKAPQEAPKAPSKAPKASAKQEAVKAPKASAKGQKEAPKAHKGQRVKA